LSCARDVTEPKRVSVASKGINGRGRSIHISYRAAQMSKAIDGTPPVQTRGTRHMSTTVWNANDALRRNKRLRKTQFHRARQPSVMCC
jgi:hypothetical protein